ncbi:hypothetical protein ABPG73_008938 [Tetrahymena malaccensis]
MDSKQITKNKDEQQEELLKDNDKGQSDYFTKKGYNIQGKLGSGIISNDQKMNENRNYQSPEVQKNEKPFTIMADVFTVGLFLIQGFIKRDLTSSELLNLRSKNLFEAVPELKQSQDNKFITEIVSHMVNHEKQQRLEPTKLLENLKEFQFNENCLQNLKLNQNTSQDKNTEKNISNEKSSQINNAKKIHPELIQENKDATEQTQAQLGKTLSQNQNVDSITFSKENNVSETSDLSSCKEVILKYRNAFEKQYCFFTKFGVENVTKAICCLSPNKNIKSLNLDLSGNKIGKKGIKLIATDLEKLTNLTTLNLDLFSNNIGSNGTIEICKCIEELKDLTSLSLHLILQNDFSQNEGLTKKTQTLTNQISNNHNNNQQFKLFEEKTNIDQQKDGQEHKKDLSIKHEQENDQRNENHFLEINQIDQSNAYQQQSNQSIESISQQKQNLSFEEVNQQKNMIDQINKYLAQQNQVEFNSEDLKTKNQTLFKILENIKPGLKYTTQQELMQLLEAISKNKQISSQEEYNKYKIDLFKS